MPSAPRPQHAVPQHAPPPEPAAAAEFDYQNARHIAQMDDLMALLHKNLLEDPLIFKMGVQDEVLAAGHKCTLGFDLEGCTISKVLPGGPAFATRQVAEGDTIVEVDRRQATEQNILRCLIGDDIEGSICKLRLLKAESGAGQPVEVIIRRARTDVVQEQELAFQLLTDLKHHAVQNNDAESAAFVEKLGRQFVRIVLDRQDKERALAVQHKNLQEDSLRTLEELHKGIHKHLFPLQQNSLTLQNVKELEEELSRHIALEQELKKLIDALERQLESANATEMDLRRQLQTVVPAMHDKVLQAEEQFKATQNELVQVQELADQLHASLEQETGLKKAMVLELESQREINQATTLELQSLKEINQAMVLELSSQKDINSEGSRKLLEAHDKAKLLEEVLAVQEHPQGNKGALDIATQHDGKITQLQDQLYHKEEALWLLREELASKDRHIKAIEDDFEELKHMLNEFDVLSAKLSVVTLERDQMALQLSQSSTSPAIQQNRNSQPDSRVGDAERTYGRSVCSVDYLPPPSVIPQSVEDAMPQILQGNQTIRYMPSPPKTPGDTYGDSSVEMDSEGDRKSREDWSPNGDVLSMLPVSPDAIRQAFMPPFEPGRSSLIQLPPGVPPFDPGLLKGPPQTQTILASETVYRSDRSPAVPQNAMPQALRVAGEFLRLKNSPPNEIPNRLQLKQPEIRVQEQPMQENDAQGEQEGERQKRQGCKQTKENNRSLVHKLANVFVGRRR